MIRSLWPVLLTLAATPALAQESKVYDGVAGPAHIVVRLTEDNEAVTGSYFYLSTRLDIALSGQRHGHAMDLRSEVTNDRLTLTRSGDDLVGTLTTGKGRKLSVSIHPAAAPLRAPPDLPVGLDLYERLRLSGLSFVPQEVESQSDKTIRWYREPLTGIRLFRLETGYAATAMAAMNHALAQQQWSAVAAWFQCTASGGRPGTEVDQSEKPWLGPAYVSYVWRSAWDCAGTAHPDFGAEGHSFDARSGRELRLDEVLPEGNAAIPPENSDTWFDYRSRVFAPAVVTIMQRYHPVEMALRKNGDCNYTDPKAWAFPSWTLTEKGLWLGAIFARADRACDSPEWSVIPWSALAFNSVIRR
jgi:hypothetical protein